MPYVDGLVAAVPTANKQKYIAHAEQAAVIFREYGVLQSVECWGDDVPDGEITSFPMAVNYKDDESVCFSWIISPSREIRNATIGKVRQDTRLHPDHNPLPLDGMRMIYGGFEMIVDHCQQTAGKGCRMRKYLLTAVVLMLMLASGCQSKWVRLDGASVEDSRLEKARQACRVDRKLAALARAEDDSDRNLATTTSNEARMLVKDDFDLVRRQVYAEIDTCMQRHGFRRLD